MEQEVPLPLQIEQKPERKTNFVFFVVFSLISNFVRQRREKAKWKKKKKKKKATKKKKIKIKIQDYPFGQFWFFLHRQSPIGNRGIRRRFIFRNMGPSFFSFALLDFLWGPVFFLWSSSILPNCKLIVFPPKVGREKKKKKEKKRRFDSNPLPNHINEKYSVAEGIFGCCLLFASIFSFVFYGNFILEDSRFLNLPVHDPWWIVLGVCLSINIIPAVNIWLKKKKRRRRRKDRILIFGMAAKNHHHLDNFDFNIESPL